MLGEALNLAANVKITHTPYQGEAPAVIAAAGGHITGVLVNVFSVAPFVKKGKLRGLAVTSVERDALRSRRADCARSRRIPRSKRSTGRATSCRPARQRASIARLNAEIVKPLNAPDVRESLKAQGLMATPSTPEQFAALLKIGRRALHEDRACGQHPARLRWRSPSARAWPPTNRRKPRFPSVTSFPFAGCRSEVRHAFGLSAASSSPRRKQE